MNSFLYTCRAATTVMAAALLLGSACGEPLEDVPPELRDAPGFRTKIFYLEAPCQVNVEGVGMVDVEEEYIPGVVSCENPSSGPEGLKAQAVEARSFLYYKLFVAGQTTIRNSQADQVYSCSYRPNGPGPEHYEAARATKGQFLMWENSIVASFYVAGAIPPNPDPADPWGSCMPNGGSDPTSTQRWVTYNRGKTGCNIDLTNLGFVPADCRGNPHNRGCASQNGHTCLDAAGVPYQDQFAYFYGDDIQLVVAEGRCGGPPPLSPEDQFCTDNGDGSFCWDETTRIDCAGGAAGMMETCDLGCAEGACALPPTMDACTDQPDGDLCDGANRVSCVDGAISASEVCQHGCTDGVCNPDDGDDVVPGPVDDDTDDPDDGTGAEEEDDDDRDGDGSPLEAEPGAVPPVVGPSPGLEGGCSTTPHADASLWSLALFGFVAAARRRRSSR